MSNVIVAKMSWTHKSSPWKCIDQQFANDFYLVNIQTGNRSGLY